MGTKQHHAFCPECGRVTNHVTVYEKSDGGGSLIARVRCAEHSEKAA
jgi:uncharacterized radical SAM superfamily Fe-S cluster-containing enzyme